MAELKYEIVENLGTLGENARGWSKEVNLISWNEKEPKYEFVTGLRITAEWKRRDTDRRRTGCTERPAGWHRSGFL